MANAKFTKGIRVDDQERIEIDADQILPQYLKEMEAAGVELAPGRAFDGKRSALALEIARSIAIFDCKIAAREASGDTALTPISDAMLHFRIVDHGGEGWMRLKNFADGKDLARLAQILRPLVRPALAAIVSQRRGRPIREPADGWVRPAWW